jgi:hypothetical protein
MEERNRKGKGKIWTTGRRKDGEERERGRKMGGRGTGGDREEGGGGVGGGGGRRKFPRSCIGYYRCVPFTRTDCFSFS